LFTECQGGNGPSGNELDTYLQLQRLNPGNSFSQMSRSRRFGSGMGFGQSGGSGDGSSGSSGYAVMDGSNPSVLGNESFASNRQAVSRQSSPYGHGAGAAPLSDKGGVLDPDVVNGLNAVNRHSAANSPETEIEEYNDVVDSYFKTIATKKEKPADEKSH
jgi:hypothetical protein